MHLVNIHVKNENSSDGFAVRRAAAHDPGMSIRTLRRLKGLTQTELAEKAGVSQSSVSRAEKLDDSVTLDTFKAISAALNVTLSDLFKDDREGDERAILEAYRALSPDRKKGWGDMAKAVLLEPNSPGRESDQVAPDPSSG